MSKHIFVTGGVVSGLGKGITAASLGRLLKQRGLSVMAQKLDPYMNIDPGTMSPLQHGEVFVTDDGAETDLDLGHYERFIDENLTKYANLTSGKVYESVLSRERTGAYLGKTVQVIPHVTGTIKQFIYESANSCGADVMITEIGGTVGDIESQPFLEAIRQISREVGHSSCLFIHVTWIPYLQCSGEHKSKPTQHSVKELRAMGISPDILVARADERISQALKEKIALFASLEPRCVVENITSDSLYDVPLQLHENGLDDAVCRALQLDVPAPDLAEWTCMTQKIRSRAKRMQIAIVGKYIRLHDAYLSIVESLHHAGFEIGAHILIRWVDSETLRDDNVAQQLADVDGILVPGGFGNRGIEGMIAACRYAREQNIPYLGICLGMQIAVIEFARNVCALEGANSAEFVATPAHPVIDIMPGQHGMVGSGGTMRLGAYPCKITEGSILHRLYNVQNISERHRHRFEVNNAYRDTMERHGLSICGQSPDGNLVEAVSLPQNGFFVGVQYHPEFKSRPNRPHPLFLGFLSAGMNGQKA